MTPYIIAGLVTGSIYAISALGLVLTYSSSRVFNFAHGAIAYVDRRLLLLAHTRQDGWSIAVAAPFTILIVAPLFGLAALLRRSSGASPHARRPFGSSRRSDSGWRSRRWSHHLPVRPNGEIFQPDGLVNNPPDPQFLKVFGTYVNTNQFAVIVSAVVIAIGHDAGAPLHPARPRHARVRRPPAERVDRRHQHRGVTAISWMAGIDARRIRRRAPRARSSACPSSSSRSCSSARSPPS